MANLQQLNERLPALSSDLDASRRHYEASWAPSTRRAYAADWRCWMAYCADRGIEPLPGEPASIAAYLSALADGTWGKKRAVSTIERRKSALGHIHVQSGFVDPTADPRVGRVLTGIRRQKTVRPSQKAAARARDIINMVDRLGDDPRSTRDRALILLGFAGGFRRSELVALQLEDVREHPHGLLIEVRRSKSDQEGRGSIKLIRMGTREGTCPVRALKRWVSVGNITAGSLFRSIGTDLKIGEKSMSDRAVARAVQRAAVGAGLNPTQFSGHSLRSGYVTEADARGARASDIMAQTGHRTDAMLQVYTRYNVDDQFQNSTALDVGL